MILRKPYAFFIKMFKPIHLFFSALILYLIFRENKIVSFLNNYIYTSDIISGQGVSEGIIKSSLYIIPIFIIIGCIIILTIMFNKKKPIKFYLVTVFSFIVVIVINAYASSFLNVMQEHVVAVKSAKLIHDLVLINIIIETIAFLFLIIRGMGINIKKFNFDSDISKIDISESDKEEFELDLNVDLDEAKRKRKRRYRYLKYKYLENKFLYNIIGASIIAVIAIISIAVVLVIGKRNKENVIYATSTFDLAVNNSYILNTDYKGNKLTDNYLVVVDAKLRSFFDNNEIYLKDFSLKIENATFKPTNKYSTSLSDLGTYFTSESLTTDYDNYLFVYELPEKYINDDIEFNYKGANDDISILLNPKSIEISNFNETKKMGEEIELENMFEGLKFNITNFEINDSYKVEYKYCFKDDDCMNSIEYVKPSLDKNYDKTILKININYENTSKLNLPKFYNFLEQFGEIQYLIDDKWYSQNSGFEDIRSKKKQEKNVNYIGVNMDIKKASSIKFVFNIRGAKYEYILK